MSFCNAYSNLLAHLAVWSGPEAELGVRGLGAGRPVLEGGRGGAGLRCHLRLIRPLHQLNAAQVPRVAVREEPESGFIF